MIEDKLAILELLAAYSHTLDNGDDEGWVQLFTADAVWEMPPNPSWFAGRDAVLRLLEVRLAAKRSRLVPVRANGQPGFAMYVDGEAFAVQVVTLRGPAIAAVTAFHDAALVERFGLPRRL